MKQCKRVPLECVNKCGVKNVPREEVSILKYVFSLRSTYDFQGNKNQIK